MTTWFQTHSGKVFDLERPQAADVDFDDVAWHLAQIPRFNGAPNIFYSVGEHSVRVGMVVEAEAPTLGPLAPGYGVLHDGHEFALGDDITPKRLALAKIAEQEFGVDVAQAVVASLAIQRRRIDAVLHEAAGLPYPVPLDIIRAIKRADRLLLKTEKRDLLRPSSLPWAVDGEEGEPLAGPIVPYAIAAAETMFRTACQRWLPACRPAALGDLHARGGN